MDRLLVLCCTSGRLLNIYVVYLEFIEWFITSKSVWSGRIEWCRGGDSNSHGCKNPLVPETSASADSATAAYILDHSRIRRSTGRVLIVQSSTL